MANKSYPLLNLFLPNREIEFYQTTRVDAGKMGKPMRKEIERIGDKVLGGSLLLMKDVIPLLNVEGTDILDLASMTNLRDLQSLALLAGANGLIIGNYLTTPGRNAEEDLRMISDLGFMIP